MASASVMIAVRENVGERRRNRNAYFQFFTNESKYATRCTSRKSSINCVSPPNSKIACRRASSGASPSAILSRISLSRWKRSSALNCVSADLFERFHQNIAPCLLRGSHNESYGAREPVPIRLFGFQLLSSFRRQPVKLGLPRVIRFAPIGL